MTSSVGAAQQVASGAKAISFLSQVDSGSDVKAQGGRSRSPSSRIRMSARRRASGSEGGAASQRREGARELPDERGVAVGPCRKNIPNVSPVRAPGCYETPADFQPPPVNDKGIYPGMDDEALKTQALKELGLK
jgi:hypothetical protein